LLGAQVRVVVEIGGEAIERHQRRHRGRQLPRRALVEHAPQVLQHDPMIGAAGADVLAGDDRRAQRDFDATLRAVFAGLRDDHDRRDAQCIAGPHAEAHGVFPSGCQRQRLCWRA